MEKDESIEGIINKTYDFNDIISTEKYHVYFEKDTKSDLMGEYTEIVVFVDVKFVNSEQSITLTEGLHFDDEELEGIKDNLEELLDGVAKNMINYRLNHQALVKKSNDINDI